VINAPALPPAIYHAYMDSLRRLMSDPAQLDSCEILVAGPSGSVLGCIAFFPDAGLEGFNWPKGWGGLRALAVDPSARGLGLGRRLAEAALGRARAMGSSVVCLHNAAFQAPARRLYLDLGFVRCPQFDFDVANLIDPSRTLERQPVEAFAIRLI